MPGRTQHVYYGTDRLLGAVEAAGRGEYCVDVVGPGGKREYRVGALRADRNPGHGLAACDLCAADGRAR